MIVVIADITWVLDIAMEQDVGLIKFMQVIKALRIFRLFRLIRVSKNLRVLVDSLIVIFPSVANVGSLILLILFIFSVIGVNMFSNVIH